ncbi:kinesin family member 2/24 [Boeremia exigua]|uniref:kinesin family member 2/24 n=1 Tax=Boeremia exigua TaxID=749465 RepID=UPI001E8D7133|nr:kinesin family member 2/24 [Boeremia exigua]KAH6616473.1 kinesin family member 2/24 [Boeremia exigua]
MINSRIKSQSPFEIYVRSRPLSSDEQSKLEPELSIIHDKNSRVITLSSQCDPERSRKWSSGVSFAQLFTGSVTNEHVYESTVKPALDQVMLGATCNFFAYGHSGSGKTHTVIGYEYDDSRHLGLCLSAARDLFQAIQKEKENPSIEDAVAGSKGGKLGVAVRLYEVRGKSAFDLLNNGSECHVRQGPDGHTHVRGKTEILEGGKVRVRPIVAKPVWSYDELQQTVLAGLKMREIGSSSIHNESSRTHAFIELEVIDNTLLKAREVVIERESELVPVGKLATDIYIEEQMKSLIRTEDGRYIPNPDSPLDQDRVDAAEAKKREFEERLEQAVEAVKECFTSSKHRCLGGKFVFVDLAGSEYFEQAAGKSAELVKQTPQERQQGRQINTDLFALKEVIRARASGQTRIPFRSSPLTMVLRSHFEGSSNGRSSIILTVSPLETQYVATKNTLSYGSLISGR